MSSNSRRTLVSRARRDENINPSSAQRRPRDSNASVAHQPTPLPPYEPPSCPLTASAKRALEALPRQHDKENYARHIKLAIKNVTSSATEPSDRLLSRKNRVKQQREKRQKLGQNNQEKTDREMEAEEYAEDLEKKVVILTAKAEKALRELIDYSEELAMRDVIMKEVSTQIPAPVAQPPGGPRERRRRVRDDDEDGDAENEEDEDIDDAAPASDANVLSAVEIHKKLKEDFQTSWASKTMRERYASNNDYKGFKRVVHDATYGPDGPDVPRANTWFPVEAGDVPDTAAARNRRRLANRTDNIGNAGDEDEDEDDDIIIAGVKTSLKCPLTLKLMEHPLSNNKCVHAFEKTAILEYLRDSGTAYSAEPRRRGQQPTGPKQVKCPQGGCNAMLGEEDFYEDQLLTRQVKRAAKAEAVGFDEDEDDDRDPRGTQRNAHQVSDNGDDEDEDISMQINMKNERVSQASGLGVESSPEPDEDEIEDMEV